MNNEFCPATGAVETMTSAQLAKLIDHTYLKAFGAAEPIERLCAEAKEFGFGAVCVNPFEIERCVKLLAGSEVRVCTVISFPLGQMSSAAKAWEIEDALKRGAREVDMVENVRALQEGNYELVAAEFVRLGQLCREHGAVSKVILENCYLTDAEKRKACELAVQAGLDFVKTSTGFGTGGATVADVQLMRQAVGPTMGVKAAGGIRDLASALAMIRAGATRIGTSAGVKIVEALRAQGR